MAKKLLTDSEVLEIVYSSNESLSDSSNESVLSVVIMKLTTEL